MPAANTKQFVWFDSYTKAALAIPDESIKAELITAIVMFGALGEEPSFNDWTLQAIFEGLRPNIENSRNAFSNSTKAPAPGKKKRGRPRKEQQAEIVDDVDAFVEHLESDIPVEVIAGLAEQYEAEHVTEVW